MSDCQGDKFTKSRGEDWTLISDKVEEIEPRTRGERFRNSIASLRFFTFSKAARNVALRAGVPPVSLDCAGSTVC